MSYIDLIHEYLDQGLDETKESALFAELARDSQLRSEFQFQLKLQKLTQFDMMTIAPPVAATSAIFSNLGFSIPNNEVAAADKSDDKRKYMLLLALFFALTASSAIYYLWNFQSKDNLAHTKPSEAMAVNYQPNSEPESSAKLIPVARQSEQSTKVKARASSSIVPIIASENKGTDDSDRFVLDRVDEIKVGSLNNQLTTAIQNSLGGISNDNYVLTTLENQQVENSAFGTNSPKVISQINTGDDHFKEVMIEVKGLSTQMNDKVLQELHNSDILKNWSIAGFYRLNQYHSFAVEFGNEQFVIRNRLDADSRSVIWLGPTYRFTASNLVFDNIVDPYIQLSIAATQGIIAKSGIGLIISPNNAFSGSIAYELATLVRGASSTDQYVKRGLTIGFSYKLSIDK